MSLVGFFATAFGGATVAVIAITLSRSGHDCRESSVCVHCRDTGAVATNERRPRAQFCNFCELGRVLARRAAIDEVGRA